MRQNKKGFTLIELVVALAITTIIMAAIGGILFSSYKIFNNIVQTNEDKLVGDAIYNWISEKVILANDVEIINEQSVVLNTDDTITIDGNGRLLYNGVDIYGDAFYNNKKISISIAKNSTESVSVDVSVWQGLNKTYSAGSVMKLLNYDFST